MKVGRPLNLFGPGIQPGLIYSSINEFEGIHMTINIARNYFDVIRRFGVAGIAFFFVKGMLWRGAPFVIAWLF